VAYAARATVFANLDRPAEMRRDLAALGALDLAPDVDHIRLHRACMLTPLRHSRDPARTGATESVSTIELPDICRRLGYIYLFGRLELRQQATLF
jgi:hypothetical protein